MFNLFKKQPTGEQITLKIDGMHCVSCGLSIDGDLEDTQGILEATTSYAKGETKVTFDPEKIDVDAIKKIIKETGYNVK
jgi:copper chaperone CopZ